MEEDTTEIVGFHAHVYFDTGTRDVAAHVREGLGGRFDVKLGRWFDQPIGPHPKVCIKLLSYQISLIKLSLG